jgi:hypothetical protein
MSGPLSVPCGDKQFYNELRSPKCDKHDKCWGGKGTKKNPCVMISTREWLLRRNRLATGKTK